MTIDDIRWLTATDVRELHDAILEPKNLSGESLERPIEGALGRVENRFFYNQDNLDIVLIATTYAVYIARSHSFNDGNKRTAFQALLVFLEDHGFELAIPDDGRLTPVMEDVASGNLDENGLHQEIIDYVSPLPE